MVSAIDARASEPEPYNFDRPVSLARDQSRMLMAGFESFARQWNIELSARVRTASQITPIDVQVLPYDDYVTSLDEASTMVLCAIEGVRPRAVVQLPLGPALGWLGRMLGGNGSREIAPRPFSPVEQALIVRTVNDAIELLRYSFGDLFPENMRVESFSYVPQTAQAATPSDAMIVASFDVTVDENDSQLSIAIPAVALASSLAGGHARTEDDPAAGLMRAQLDSVPVRVALQFQATTVRPEVVLSLVEGDVIRIAHSKNRPLNFAVEGQVLARAAVGASGSQLACVIVDTQEPTGAGTP